MNYRSIRVRFQESVCFLQLNRPGANNAINEQMVAECLQVLDACEDSTTVIVIEGLPEVFCFGVDFENIHSRLADGGAYESSAEPLYDLWLRLACGPYITIAHVRGRANAGGVGFVAACDIVLADDTAQFSLSELLFGVYPACVMPFLMRRAGFQRAHYLTLSAQPIPVQQAQAWGLVDAYDAQSDVLLRKHVQRLRRLSKTAIRRYKRYMSELHGALRQSGPLALAAHHEVFSDPQVLDGIHRFVETGQFPWE